MLALFAGGWIICGAALAGETIDLDQGPLKEDLEFLQEKARELNPLFLPEGSEEPDPKNRFTLENFGLRYFDLNDDGVPELFVEFNHSYMCGSGGCDTEIYRTQNGRRVLLAEVNTHGQIFAADEKIKGWRTLCGFEMGLRWGKSDVSDGEGYESFCISKRCMSHSEDSMWPEVQPDPHRYDKARACKDSPISRK